MSYLQSQIYLSHSDPDPTLICWLTVTGDDYTQTNLESSNLQTLSGLDNKIADRLYPENWIPQANNFLKVELSSDSEEYKQIQSNFLMTLKASISKIYRLQNKKLWRNYNTEQLTLQELYQESNIQLTQLEQERYLWHGVHSRHPKQIYESKKEAFDITYSKKKLFIYYQQGMWGTGMYFAESAAYTNNYSYKLTQQDDPIHAGESVFLCCKVATGKVYECKSDLSIRKPQIGYDCVGGYTNGSNIYVLYGMDVRRANPAYEIIYK